MTQNEKITYYRCTKLQLIFEVAFVLMANKDANALIFENNYKGVSMEFLSHMAIVAGVLLFSYNLVKMGNCKIPITESKDNNPPNGNLVKENSIENCNVKNGLEPKLDHYGKYVAIKSKKISHGKAVGLAAEEAFFLMRNSQNPHIAVDDEGNIHYC